MLQTYTKRGIIKDHYRKLKLINYSLEDPGTSLKSLGPTIGSTLRSISRPPAFQGRASDQAVRRSVLAYRGWAYTVGGDWSLEDWWAPPLPGLGGLTYDPPAPNYFASLE